MPEDDRAFFERIWKRTKATMHEIFQRDKNHSHLIFLIVDKEVLMAVSYDQVASQIVDEEKDEPSEDEKNLIFTTMANVAYEKKAIGYIEIGEGWAMLAQPESSFQDTLSQYQTLKESYGYLKNMPTRMEVLYIRGRYRGFSANLIYKIRRAGEECWLEPIGETKEEEEITPYEVENHSRIGLIDKAVDKILEEESAV